MEGTYDIPYKNYYFFETTEPNQMGFFGQNADNGLQFHNPKAYSDSFTIFWNLLILKIWLHFFLGGGGGQMVEV